MKAQLKISVVLFLSFLLVFVACKRDEKKDNYRSAKDNSTAENMFDDVFAQVKDGVVKAQDSVSGKKTQMTTLSLCATITISPFDAVTFPKTIVVDFGTINCLGTDGRYRRGKININTTGWYRDSAAVITVTPENYYVNENKVQGTKTITNQGHNASGHLVYKIDVSNASVTTSEGLISWESLRYREWIEGESTTLNPWDDVYLITGSADGVNVEGEHFNVTILTPLRIKIGCRWIAAGSLKLTSDGTEIIVDYGDGSCDASATVTINGNTYNILML